MTKFKLFDNSVSGTPRVVKSDHSRFGVLIRQHEDLDKAYIVWDSEDIFIGRNASGDDVKYIEVELCELVNE